MLLATVLFTGCTFNYEEESFEDLYPGNIYHGDSIMQNLHNAASDTTYIPRQTNNRRDNNTPYECNLMANARLIIDGGNEKENNPSLKVTVSKIVIQIYRDGLQRIHERRWCPSRTDSEQHLLEVLHLHI